MIFADGVVAPINCGSTVVLEDPFDDAVAAPLFMPYTNNGMTISEAAGAVTFEFAASVGAGRYAGYEAVQTYAAQQMCATVEVSQLPTDFGLGYFNLFGGTQQIEFISYQGNLELRTHEGTTIKTIGLFPLDLAAQRFWRLRQQGGVTYWDVSADGTQFFMLASSTFFVANTARASIGAGAAGVTTDGGRFSVERALITKP